MNYKKGFLLRSANKEIHFNSDTGLQHCVWWSLGGIDREIVTSASETKTLTPVFVT